MSAIDEHVSRNGGQVESIDPELHWMQLRAPEAEPGGDLLEQMRARQPTAEDAIGGRAISHRESVVRSREGNEIVVSIFESRRKPEGSSRPGFLFIHGGGMVAGNRFMDVEVALDWVEMYGVTVVSVEYRLAPENPFPAALLDVQDVLEWMGEHAEDLAMETSGFFVVGTSAGGGIAAQLSLLVRETGGPTIHGLALICPMLDDRGVTPSSCQPIDRGGWDREHNVFGWRSLLGPAIGDEPPRFAVPAREKTLSGLPATYLDAGSAELFRDEIVDFASRIWAQGGVAELHVWAGGYHAFDILTPGARVSQAARRARNSWIERRLAYLAALDAPRSIAPELG